MSGSIALIVLLVATLVGDGVTRHHRLFIIERSKGPAIVCYDAVTQDGKLDEDDPIDAYWQHPDKNNEREELNWIERWQAFGVKVKHLYDGRDSVDFVIKAYNKNMRVVKRDGRWMALTYVDGQVCQLMSIYVRTDESGMMPKVLDVMFKGRARRTGQVVTEMLKP